MEKNIGIDIMTIQEKTNYVLSEWNPIGVPSHQAEKGGESYISDMDYMLREVLGEIDKATFTGAVFGGLSAMLNGAAGDGAFIERLLKHTFAQGWLEGIQGGNVLHGFVMGAVSGMGGHLINEHAASLGRTGKIVANAVLSGTIDELGGGKFANGAITGAFSIMFNDMLHSIQFKRNYSAPLLA